MRLDEPVPYAGPERRRSVRVALHWSVLLACTGATHPLRAQTRDISRDGFYCIVNRLIQPGDLLTCDLAVPAHDLHNRRDVFYLRCQIRAVRVEKIGTGTEFGLACRIENFRVIHVSGESSQNASRARVEQQPATIVARR